MNHLSRQILRRCSTTSSYLSRAKAWTASDFDYELPEERIALRPLPTRDVSRLLVIERRCNTRGLPVKHHHYHFHDIPFLIPSGSMLVLNNTLVIQANVVLQKKFSGGKVQVMLLGPAGDLSVEKALEAGSGENVEWECFVGGRNVKEGDVLTGNDGELEAKVLKRSEKKGVVSFTWGRSLESMNFGNVLKAHGRLPVPPYIAKRRDVDACDTETYQTVYAKERGSVAAPTAGLHFTPNVMDRLGDKDVSVEWLTLHVGAGTFAPISGTTIGEHDMHAEQLSVSTQTLINVVSQIRERRPIIAVGTTSARTLESLYWYGCRLLLNEGLDFRISQWDPYIWMDKFAFRNLPSAIEAFDALIEYAQTSGMVQVAGVTQLIIVPSYEFRVINALITNFHLPRSTLLMLVSAFMGSQSDMLNTYNFAVEEKYRFLSYGDSTIMVPRDFLDRLRH